jgi:hypothetical protein
MGHLMGLGVVLELVTAAASLWTETNPLALAGSLSMGLATAACAVLRVLSRRDDEWASFLTADTIRR